MSATVAPAAQLVLDAVERRDPGRDEVGDVAGPEELLAADEDVVVLLVPADAGAGAERLGDPRLGLQRAERQHERAGHVDGAVRVGQREGLLLGQRVGLGRRRRTRRSRWRPGRAATRRRSAGWSRSRGQLLGGRRRLGQRLVQAEVVADDDAARRHRRAEVADELAQELHQLVAVDSHDASPWCSVCHPAQTAPGGCSGVATRLQRASIDRGQRARRGHAGEVPGQSRASSSATASRSATRCSARASPRSCSPRSIRSSTRGPGRRRCRTWPGRPGWSPSTRAATAAPTGRSRPPPTPTPSSSPTPSR